MRAAAATIARKMSDREARYLLSILERGGREVRSVDLALSLVVQKSSVSSMLSRLSSQDLVQKEAYGKVSLTQKGRREALFLRDALSEAKSFLLRTLPSSSLHEKIESVALAMVLAGGPSLVSAIAMANGPKRTPSCG